MAVTLPTPSVDSDGTPGVGTPLDLEWFTELVANINTELGLYVPLTAGVPVSWTPVLGGAGGTSGQTATAVGRYVKMGQRVAVIWAVIFTAKGTITGNLQLQGLPFTALNVGNLHGIGPIDFGSLATNWTNIVSVVQPGTTIATITGSQSIAATNNTALTTTDIGNTTFMLGSFTYFCAP